MNAAPTSPVKVFLAEDSAPVRQRLAAMFAAASMRVVGEGVTPEDCIEGILASQPDVVVLDVRLEGGSGMEVLKAVRQMPPVPAFVVFSSHSDAAYRKRYLAEGASRFLDKSSEFDRLAHTVASVASASVH